MTDKQFAALINQLEALRLELRSNNSFHQTHVNNMMRADKFAELARMYLIKTGMKYVGFDWDGLVQADTECDNDIN